MQQVQVQYTVNPQEHVCGPLFVLVKGSGHVGFLWHQNVLRHRGHWALRANILSQWVTFWNERVEHHQWYFQISQKREFSSTFLFLFIWHMLTDCWKTPGPHVKHIDGFHLASGLFEAWFSAQLCVRTPGNSPGEPSWEIFAGLCNFAQYLRYQFACIP